MSMDQPNRGQDPNAGSTPPDPYATPQGPYGVPPNPAAPVENPYATPQYQQPPGYGSGAAAPVPLGQAIGQLPGQYVKVTTRPSAQSFAQEAGKASWGIVWTQLIIYTIVSIILAYIGVQMGHYTAQTSTTSTGTVTISADTIKAIATWTVLLGYLLIVPIGFFALSGILYGLSRAFRGQGSFIAQAYTTLLFLVPLGIVSGILYFIPIVGGILAGILGIYSIVLLIFADMGTHQIRGGRATGAVIISAILTVLVVLIVFIIIGAIVGIIIYSQQHH